MIGLIYLFGVIVNLVYFSVDLLENPINKGKRRALLIYALIVAASVSWPLFWFLVVFMGSRAPKVRMER